MEPTDLVIPNPIPQESKHSPTSSLSPSRNQEGCSHVFPEPITNLHQTSAAVNAKQVRGEDAHDKGTVPNIYSLSDATVPTMADSAFNLASNNVSQAGTLNMIDNQSPIVLLKDKGSTEALSVKPEETQQRDSLQKDIEKRDPERDNGTTKNSKAEGNQETSPSSQHEKAQPLALDSPQASGHSEQDNIDKEKTRQKEIKLSDDTRSQERHSSPEGHSGGTMKTLETSDNVVPQLTLETDQSESMGQGVLDTTPVMSKGNETGKKMGLDQPVLSDQPDSEGHSSFKKGESPSNFSGLSSTEESKGKEPPKKESVAKPKVSLEDFHKLALIGRGSYGEVSLVKKISNNKIYALKAIDKYFMKKEKKEHQVYVEKEVLMKSNHPNIIKFFSSFQDKKKLYFVLEYVGGGEFSDYLRAQRKLKKDEIKFFTAEIINILDYLHSCNIAHRDIKPENLLLTVDGHLKCIDFGTARFLNENEKNIDEANPHHPKDHGSDVLSHRKTFVGTAQYVSPEMLEYSECDAAADFWALGCMIYVMAVGRYPFDESNEFLIFQKIQNLEMTYPNDMDPEIKDLVQKLLVKEPYQRLGAGPKGSGNDINALKAHPLFKGIDFATLHKQKSPIGDIVSPHRLKEQTSTNPTVTPPVEDPAKKLVPNRKHFLSEDMLAAEEKTGKAPAAQATKPNPNPDKILLSGLVLKKSGWLFFRPKQLVLNNKPRLVYYDPETNQLKGEIPLEPGTVAELESKNKWVINTPKKKFYFKEMEHAAEKWVEAINSAVAQMNQNKANKQL